MDNKDGFILHRTAIVYFTYNGNTLAAADPVVSKHASVLKFETNQIFNIVCKLHISVYG